MDHMGYSLFTLCGKQQFIISHNFLGYYSFHVILVVTILIGEVGLCWNMPKSFSYMSGASTGVVGTAGDFLLLSFLIQSLSSDSSAHASLHGS